MKPAIALLTLVVTALPSHAAPRNCRLAARVNRAHVAVNAKAANHAKTNLVITAFAVPVAVPVAPFSPYWYGLADYHGATSQNFALSQEHCSPHTAPFADSGRAAHPAPSVVSQRCGACHGAVSPKQGLSLIDPPSLSAENRLRALRAVVTGAMPPESEEPLTDADREAIIHGLLGDADENPNAD